jgi:hypothetical protein
MAAPTIHDSTSLFGNAGTVTVTAPTMSNDDVLFIIATGRAARTPSAPAGGFTFLLDENSGSAANSHARAAVWYKAITDAGSEPASYDVVWSSNPFGDHFAVSVSGADLGSPVNVFASLGDIDAGATVDSPTATTTVNECRVLRLGLMARDGGIAAGSWAPTDATEIEDPGSSLSSGFRIVGALAHETAAVAGATGTETWSVTAADFGNALGITIAVAPPGVAAVVPGEILVEGVAGVPAGSSFQVDASDLQVPAPNLNIADQQVSVDVVGFTLDAGGDFEISVVLLARFALFDADSNYRAYGLGLARRRLGTSETWKLSLTRADAFDNVTELDSAEAAASDVGLPGVLTLTATGTLIEGTFVHSGIGETDLTVTTTDATYGSGEVALLGRAQLGDDDFVQFTIDNFAASAI